jgi:hypothetical protein
MERLDRALREELGRFGPADAGMVDIVRVWPAAVGPTVARNAWPARLARDGTLHVHTSSSTWAFELGNLAATILEQLGIALDSPPPTLRFTPGPLPEPTPSSPADAPPPRIEPTPELRAQAESLAAGIEDEELRRTVARAAAASLARAAAEPADDRRF